MRILSYNFQNPALVSCGKVLPQTQDSFQRGYVESVKQKNGRMGSGNVLIHDLMNGVPYVYSVSTWHYTVVEG